MTVSRHDSSSKRSRWRRTRLLASSFRTKPKTYKTAAKAASPASASVEEKQRLQEARNQRRAELLAKRVAVPFPPREDAEVFVIDHGLRNALKAARERGEARVAEILADDEMLSAEAFAEQLGTTRETVNAKRQKGLLLGLQGAKRGYRYPVWQVGEDGLPFEALPALLKTLEGPWAVYRFLVQHHAELGGLTGREALRQGRGSEVLDAAQSVVQAFA